MAKTSGDAHDALNRIFQALSKKIKKNVL